ncbi:MAG: hypothetical protein LBF69_00965 [Prevotellaceae bacterium]|jgi:6-phosphogluconate dehydrogenase (decarboxylating)|nr:hypothetical protein [Prevotellaceae bacterium]
MAVYCISYDLKNKNGEPLYEQLITAIQSYGNWWHQSKSTWFIETGKTARQILEKLDPFLLDGDKIIVIEVKSHWWANGHTEKEYQWMKERKF